MRATRLCCPTFVGDFHTLDCAEAIRQRPEDQRPPIPNDKPRVHELVMQDVLDRMELGTKRYGTPLQPFNGRDVLRDIYEEILDAACYIRQLMYERDNPEEIYHGD